VEQKFTMISKTGLIRHSDYPTLLLLHSVQRALWAIPPSCANQTALSTHYVLFLGLSNTDT